jgi:RNA polymerase sigma-70 factor (ECF subfamily)
MTTNLALNRVTRNHEVPADLPDRALPGDLEHEVEIRVESEALKTAIANLPENLRHPLLLHEYAGRSCGQIGEQLGISPGAVRVRLFRARRALADALAGWA